MSCLSSRSRWVLYFAAEREVPTVRRRLDLENQSAGEITEIADLQSGELEFDNKAVQSCETIQNKKARGPNVYLSSWGHMSPSALR